MVSWVGETVFVCRWSVGRWGNCQWVGSRLLVDGSLSVVGDFVIRRFWGLYNLEARTDFLGGVFIDFEAASREYDVESVPSSYFLDIFS